MVVIVVVVAVVVVVAAVAAIVEGVDFHQFALCHCCSWWWLSLLWLGGCSSFFVGGWY